MDELNNIWNADDELNEEQLLNYIRNTTTPDTAHEVEKKMASSPLVNDGVEGLQQFSSTQKINAYVQQINNDLHRQLADKKPRKHRGIQHLSWEIIALIVVIILCILGFVVIRMMRG
ncbi:MAG: hypothetical protein JST21_01035 [Bacteroidetes bacterium]|nr:hypothetical protein [Bacteroidota bacterium]